MLSHKKRTGLIAVVILALAMIIPATAMADQIHIGNAVTTHGNTPAAETWVFHAHQTLPKRVGVIKATGSWVTTSFRTLVHRVSCVPLLSTWHCSASHAFFIGKIAGRPHMRDVHVIGHLIRSIPLTGFINKRTASYCFRISLHKGPIRSSFWHCPRTYPPYGPVD
jgi:hypothetical protein